MNMIFYYNFSFEISVDMLDYMEEVLELQHLGESVCMGHSFRRRDKVCI